MNFSLITRFIDPINQGQKFVIQVKAENPEDEEKVLRAIDFDTADGCIGSWSSCPGSMFVDIIFPENGIPLANFPITLSKGKVLNISST